MSDIAEDLGQVEWLDPRVVWGNEAHHFTPWLKENVDLLGRAIGLELEVEVEREVAVGSFWADLVGTDAATGRRVLIENQLADTDHRHLGQLLTYAGGLETDILVWVAPRIREEHRQALIWLNENTREGTAFFGVEIQLLKIDRSRPAPHFNVVVEPNEWQKTIARESSAGRTSERGERYRAFWRRLLGELTSRDPSATTASPDRAPAQNWYGISLGRSGVQDNFVFGWAADRGSTVRIELYVDVGAQQQNKALFDVLYAEKEIFEAEFGEPLNWDRRDDIKASRIYIDRPGTIDDPEDALAEYCSWGAERMIRIRKVFGPRVRSVVIPAEIPPNE